MTSNADATVCLTTPKTYLADFFISPAAKFNPFSNKEAVSPWCNDIDSDVFAINISLMYYSSTYKCLLM